MSLKFDSQYLDQVLSHYQCSSNNSLVSPLGNGLINDTFLVKNHHKTFVLQRVNQKVFPKPHHVVENADRINQHLTCKKENHDYPLHAISTIKTVNNDSLVQIGDDHWRAIAFIPKCFTVEAVTSEPQAYQVAQAFGQFSSALSDFPAEELHVIIDKFHDINARMEQLSQAIKNGDQQRVFACREIVNYCLSQTRFIDDVTQLVSQLPVQVTHNDTKINNLLFSEATQQPTAVIDLDTCMPGYLMHDFGDMVRTCCSNLPEDGTDIATMKVRFDIFKGLADGYQSSFKTPITQVEQQSLVIGAQLLPFMIGVRFLTDYLNGDVYFHVQHEVHNLDRAINQLHLYRLLSSQQDKLQDIVHSFQRLEELSPLNSASSL